MNNEIFGQLEEKINSLVEKYETLKKENEEARAMIKNLESEKEQAKERVDSLIAKIESMLS